jgi:hypothetical protein
MSVSLSSAFTSDINSKDGFDPAGGSPFWAGREIQVSAVTGGPLTQSGTTFSRTHRHKIDIE